MTFNKWFILSLVMSNVCYAGPISFTVNDIPIANSLVQDPTYNYAACRAQEAFLMQIGVANQLNVFTGQINSYADRLADRAQGTVMRFIDKNTPLKSKDVFMAIGLSYTILVKRQISKSFDNPFFKRVSHSIDISESQQVLTASIHF